ncbi:Rieske [2Fe-2S] domain protein [Aspergillus homomorphus CBS 101889]|uniref:Beta-1,4-xylosidase n=1 Tax=Aspergillus homomorphus (strain CBS 101889) TaxID=1450537 RepID=A0A395HY71_ASPHC|nr:beta-1,4-xylosidase [Aspergillus homomorphus CBS 101889]RAL11808.1 beta-1,4-xylosidase [Aspergillus homomorphus CBS 101889]
MPRIPLAPLASLTQTRYVIHLTTGKRLVLFRLPTIEPSTTSPPQKNEANGWSYYAMEAECPHAGGPMQDSSIDIEDSAYVVSCPWHAYDFNVETGESSVGIKACTFAVDVRGAVEFGDQVMLEYPEDGVGLVRLEPVSEKMKLKREPGKSDDAIQQGGEEIGTTAATETVTDDNTATAPVGPAKYLDDKATVCDWCAHILNTSNPEHKIELTAHLFAIFTEREGTSTQMEIGDGSGVNLPAIPPRDGLVDIKPGQMPRAGRGGTQKSRIMMLHALANIEQWAIDLAVDICVRFAAFRTNANESRGLPRAFFHDWLKVANDEAKHFSLLRTRLEEMGSYFGAIPVHHGLWESATATAHDLRARISIIALVHEARGLDVNPMTIDKFRKAGDAESVQSLEIIHNDEITHVTTGHRWLTWICGQEQTDPVQVFRANVQQYWVGALREPFNTEARMQAGLDERYYGNLVGYGRA